MNWKAWFNYSLSSAVCGGVAALVQLASTGQPLIAVADWKHTGSSFAAGALLGFIQHFRQPPVLTK